MKQSNRAPRQQYNSMTIKNSLLFLLLMFGFFNLKGQTVTHIVYAEDTTNFPNPERGFYHADASVNYDNILSYRKEGITLIFRTYHLDSYKNSRIPVSYLRSMENDFATLRKAGAKMVIRFSYTDKSTPPYGDARPDIVLQHVQQLKPILTANSDVILVLQAGFIGAWGEWYYTDYYSIAPGVISDQNWADRRELVDSLLSAIPANRMVQVRTPEYKFKLLNMATYTPVQPADAYTNLAIARIAHHNDCFVSGPNDVGTYGDSAVEKPYLANDSKYTIVGGETCQKCEQSKCSNALKEMSRFHWTFLNHDYNGSIIAEWHNEGCYPDIERKLGYRYRLIYASLQDSSKPGDKVDFNLKLVNDGWANPTNPREVELILKNSSTHKEYYLNPEGDMRFWPIHDTIRLELSAGLPENMETGSYNLYLNFPDGNTKLKDRPEYSIRLANTAVWDSVSGYNALNHLLIVDSSASANSYYGGHYFKEKNSMGPSHVHIIIDGNASDWDEIPVRYSATGQRAKKLKIYNTVDTLFLLIEGENLSADNQCFFDTDNDTSTGAFYGPWAHTGFDYMVEDNFLFQYHGTNHEFGWLFVTNVDEVHNGQVIEMKIPLDQMNDPAIANRFRLGIVNNYTAENNVSYLPIATENLIRVKKNNLCQSPIVKIKNYGTHNLIYWTRNLYSKDIYTVLQKANEGEAFHTIGIFSNDKIYDKDEDLQANQTCRYRVQYKQENDLSPFSDTIEQTASQNTNQFIDIRLDGQSDDWNLCPPSATGRVHDSMASICLFNNQAKDTLYFSIQAKMEQSYQLYLNMGGIGNFDWLLRNDSLFYNNAGNWIFKKIIPSYRKTDFLESGLTMSEIGLDTADILTATLTIDGIDVWGNGERFHFLKYQTLPKPHYFSLQPLSSDKWTKIKVKWYPNQHPEGYVIERSIDDSLHFEQLVNLASTSFQYIDKNLDSSRTYYYRMFSYKDILRSGYTPVKWMQPGHPSGINSLKNHTASVTIIPNPVKQTAKIEIHLDNSDRIKITLFALSGQKVAELFRGKIWSKKTLLFQKGTLLPGYYLLEIVGKKTSIYKKIIIS